MSASPIVGGCEDQPGQARIHQALEASEPRQGASTSEDLACATPGLREGLATQEPGDSPGLQDATMICAIYARKSTEQNGCTRMPSPIDSGGVSGRVHQ